MEPQRKATFDLSSKKSLILHNYDLFFERQTRIFSSASSMSVSLSSEIDERAEMLLLDDLTIFAICGRRLIDLCGLQGSSNKSFINHQGIDHSYEPVKTYKLDKKVGFYTLLNIIIHMTDFFHFKTRRKLKAFFSNREDRAALYRQLRQIEKEKEVINTLIILKNERGEQIMFRLEDLVDASVEVAETIIETCSRHQIFLELTMRN